MPHYPLSRAPISPSVDREIERPAGSPPEPGLALCLSGGGYRAMLFHCGALLRLAELGLLPRLDRIAGVSAGAIVAGLLGLHWRRASAGVDELVSQVIDPLRAFAGRTVDRRAVLAGLGLPGTVSDRIARAYRPLFGDATLQDLPGAEGPRVVICATNLQTGSLWRFSRPYLADWRVGRVDRPEVPLTVAVAASSAFPPFLSPLRLRLAPMRPLPDSDLHFPPYTTQAVLTDGAAFDNLGLETVWKRYTDLLVSDAGGRLDPQPRPPADWLRHGARVVHLQNALLTSLRRRQLLESYAAPAGSPLHRRGAWFSFAGYTELLDALPCAPARVAELAHLPTRLRALPERWQQRLLNYGYAACDAAVRRYYLPDAPPPERFPYPGQV